MSAFIAEIIGTASILLFGCGVVAGVLLDKSKSNGAGWIVITFAWAIGVTLGIYASGQFSGAHLNPAVTIALWLFACFDGKKVIPYIISQTAGAFGGALVCFVIYYNLFGTYETAHQMVRGSPESLYLASIFSTYPAPELSIWHAALVEVVITSMLMGMIMALTDDGNGVPKGPLAPLLIGILVAVIGASTGPLTGFAMNPARDFGPKLFTWFAGWGNIAMTGGRDIPYFIVPIIAPLLGACLGAAIYRFLIANNLPCHTCVEEENTR